MDYEQALSDVAIDSRAVGRTLRIRIITPPDFAADRVYPVLYFLHPWGLNPAYITDKLKMHVHLWNGVAEGALPPMVIVLPAGLRSFFLNAEDPPGHDWSEIVASNDMFFHDALDQYGNYGDYLLDEVMPYVEQHYPVRADRAGRAIGGISMGGAAAAFHAFYHPEHFCAVGMHSPALFTPDIAIEHIPWIFGLTEETFAVRNPADVVRWLSPDTPLRIFLDTGAGDQMLAQVEHLHGVLRANRISHEYSIPAGGHDKTYWEPRMREYLAFYAREWW